MNKAFEENDMEASFWHDKWVRGEIAFHQQQANPLLVAHVAALKLAKGNRVFLPLCGKTLDIAWLLGQGFQVAGAELSQMAVDELFQSLDLRPKVAEAGPLLHYNGPGIDIYIGDIFDLGGEMLGAVDAVYDRAALVALPVEMRRRYTAHLMKITASARQLVITYEYDQSLVDGPPFSISAEELAQHYAAAYSLTALETRAVEGGMKGKAPSTETAWLLQSK
jgi:thiopurine S-methyltransferase